MIEQVEAKDKKNGLVSDPNRKGLVFDPDKKEMVTRDHEPEAPPCEWKSLYPLYETPKVGPVHQSLTWLWWVLEIFPHRYYDRDDAKEKMRIPFGAWRKLRKNAIVHESVWQRLQDKVCYRPPNVKLEELIHAAGGWHRRTEPGKLLHLPARHMPQGRLAPELADCLPGECGRDCAGALPPQACVSVVWPPRRLGSGACGLAGQTRHAGGELPLHQLEV